MSFFGSDAFLEVLADTHFPGRSARPVEVEVGAERFRLLKVGRGKLVLDCPFLDYHTPVRGSRSRTAERVDFLPRADRGMISVGGWEKVKDEFPWEAAPLVDWSVFPDWKAFESHAKQVRSGLFRDTRRRMRRLEEHLGKVEMVFEADPKRLLGPCLEWKSAQYVESGLPNLFASARNVALFRELARRERLIVSAIFAGGHPVAIHLGVVSGGQFHYWVPSFDRRLGYYAPGRILLHFMLEESQRRGHDTFEFLIGDEAYKYHYATDVRLVGGVGRPSLPIRAWQQMRPAVASALRRMPAAYGAIRSVRHRLQEI
jgi:hypothetical protein